MIDSCEPNLHVQIILNPLLPRRRTHYHFHCPSVTSIGSHNR